MKLLSKYPWLWIVFALIWAWLAYYLSSLMVPRFGLMVPYYVFLVLMLSLTFVTKFLNSPPSKKMLISGAVIYVLLGFMPLTGIYASTNGIHHGMCVKQECSGRPYETILGRVTYFSKLSDELLICMLNQYGTSEVAPIVALSFNGGSPMERVNRYAKCNAGKCLNDLVHILIADYKPQIDSEIKQNMLNLFPSDVDEQKCEGAA